MKSRNEPHKAIVGYELKGVGGVEVKANHFTKNKKNQPQQIRLNFNHRSWLYYLTLQTQNTYSDRRKSQMKIIALPFNSHLLISPMWGPGCLPTISSRGILSLPSAPRGDPLRLTSGPQHKYELLLFSTSLSQPYVPF